MKPTEGGSNRENPDPGSYQFRFFSVIDFGTQEVETTLPNGKVVKKKKKQVEIGYELLGEKTSEGENFTIFQKYTLSGHPKASLMLHLNPWYGKSAEDVDLQEYLPGKYGNLVIVHNKSDKNKKTYANISSLAPLRKDKYGKDEKPVEKGKEPLVAFSLNDFDRELFDTFPDWKQNIIMASDEFVDVDESPKKKAKKK